MRVTAKVKLHGTFHNLNIISQTLQEELTGAVFHPLDDNLMITHGKGHLTFWNRRKDGFFERTDIIKPVKTKTLTSHQNNQKNSLPELSSPLFNSNKTATSSLRTATASSQFTVWTATALTSSAWNTKHTIKELVLWLCCPKEHFSLVATKTGKS